MRRTARALAGLAILVGIGASAPAPAWPEGDGGAAAPAGQALFSAEVFATPSYHMMEIPKVEEGGEGFTWAYVNQTPESWGRALSFWPGPTAETLFATSLPQQGPLAGHGWRAPGAWTNHPPGGDNPGEANFGDPARFPLGPTVDTPGGTMRILSFSGHADADQGVGDIAFGAFQGTAAPVNIGFARSYSSARREEGASVSSGWALARDVHVGDVGIGEIRSDASVRATPMGETATWTLTIAGVTVGGQRLAWTDKGVSFAPGSEGPLAQLNSELAKGAEGFRSEFRLVPGRVWRDDAGTHVQSGFLQMGYRPAGFEDKPGQKMVYALSVVSARALYRLGEPDVGLGDGLPAPDLGVPAPPPASAAAGSAAGSAPAGAGAAADLPAVLLVPPSVAYRDAAGAVGAEYPAVAPESPPAGAGAGPAEVALAVPRPANGSSAVRARAAPAVSGLGREAARGLRGGIGLVALAGVAAALAVMRAARRQLELIQASREGG